LKGRSEIQGVFKLGRRFAGKGAKLFALQNGADRCRICFTFPRGFGNAVQRNRARRLGREAYRHLLPRLSGACDLVLLLYPPADAAADRETLASRMAQLEFLLKKAGLLR
jgi:ribonuclease P protein component